VDLERGPFSLVSTIGKLLGRNSSCSSLEIREYSRGDPLYWPGDTLYPRKLPLTSPRSDCRSVSIVSSWTQATEFSFIYTQWLANKHKLSYLFEHSSLCSCQLILQVHKIKDQFMIKGLTVYVHSLRKLYCWDFLYFCASVLTPYNLNCVSHLGCLQSDCHAGWYPGCDVR
jgi:hypothetical protein